MAETVEKNGKRKMYVALAVIIAAALIFMIGFNLGINKEYSRMHDKATTSFENGYDDCRNAVLEAAYSAEGDNIVVLRADWIEASKRPGTAVACKVIDEPK